MSLVQLLRHLRKSAVLRSVGWQMLGSAATLATALWISWRHGLAAQGEFGLAKSWFDAATAIAALGLPHGLLHLMYRCGISAQQLLPWLRRILAVAAILCLPTAAVAAALGQQTPALIFASLPFAIAHLLARSWLLRERGEEIFGAITAMPALVLLATVLLGGKHYAWLLFGTAAIAGTISLTLVAHTVRQARAATGVKTSNAPKILPPPDPALGKKKPKRIYSIAPSRTVVLKPANMDAGCTRRRATRRTAQRCGAVRANTACTGRSILGLAYIPSVRRTRWLWCTTFIPQDCRP